MCLVQLGAQLDPVANRLARGDPDDLAAGTAELVANVRDVRLEQRRVGIVHAFPAEAQQPFERRNVRVVLTEAVDETQLELRELEVLAVLACGEGFQVDLDIGPRYRPG